MSGEREETRSLVAPSPQVGSVSTFSVQLEDFRKLTSFIKEEVEKELANAPASPYHSEDTAELNSALAKAQANYEEVTFNRTNPYLDLMYVDLSHLKRATRKALAANNLATIQFVETPDDGSTILHTRLLHSSGQWFETRARILPVKNDVAAYESALNVQKRLSFMSLLGIVPVDDPGDDDGEMAMVKSNQYIATGPSEKLDPKKQSRDVIAKHELEELEHELKDFPDLASNLLERLMLQSLADLPASQYRSTLTRIRKIKEELKNRPSDKSGRWSEKL